MQNFLHSSHDPDTPAPKYASLFENLTMPLTPDFGNYDSKKHWLMRVQQQFNSSEYKLVQNHWRNRLRTLVSVDDMIEQIFETLDGLGRLNNTIVIFMSDNGYHIGQHCLDR